LWPEKETEQRKNTLRFQVDEEELFMKTAWAIEEPSGFSTACSSRRLGRKSKNLGKEHGREYGSFYKSQ
jgi:hypothetical protein